MISVLIPCNNISRTIDLLNNLREVSVQAEFLVRIKNTDLESLTRIEELPTCRFIVGSDNGSNVHDDINELCLNAKGDILMPIEEGTEIYRHGWDLIKTGDVSVVHLGRVGICPGITRKLYNIIGHYSLHPDYISYITNVGELAKINTTVPVPVKNVNNVIKSEYDFRSRGINTLVNLDAGRIKDVSNNS
jgi:hypothetical protein